MDLKEIKAIIDLMKKNSLSEFELEQKDFKIKLKRGNEGSQDEAGYSLPRMTALPVASLPVPVAASATTAPAAVPTTPETEIKSPMIGTFYRSPSPDAAPYVDVGVEVGPDTVVAIIEAMKVMNEIKAETRGVITAMLAENAKPVEFGQPLFRIRPL